MDIKLNLMILVLELDGFVFYFVVVVVVVDAFKKFFFLCLRNVLIDSIQTALRTTNIFYSIDMVSFLPSFIHSFPLRNIVT